VRGGIALYGGAPRTGANPMRPVVALETAIAQLRSVPVGAGVGYGLTFHAARETRIATIPVGYADGCARSATGARPGSRAPRADHRARSMDSITLDVTDVPQDLLYPGAPVELIGPHQTIDDVATDAGTISYEILTQLSRRYERAYVGLPALNESLAS
jgi:alanine racemase